MKTSWKSWFMTVHIVLEAAVRSEILPIRRRPYTTNQSINQSINQFSSLNTFMHYKCFTGNNICFVDRFVGVLRRIGNISAIQWWSHCTKISVFVFFTSNDATINFFIRWSYDRTSWSQNNEVLWYIRKGLLTEVYISKSRKIRERGKSGGKIKDP